MLLVLWPAIAAAQFPATTAYLSLHGSVLQAARGVLGIDRNGTPTRFATLTTRFTNLVALEMNATNDGLLAAEASGLHHVDFRSGKIDFTALPGPVVGVTLDEDASLIWSHRRKLYRGAFRFGRTPVLLTTLHGSQVASPCWNGSTGEYVTCTSGGSPPGVLEFFDRRGCCVRSMAGIGGIHDVAWSPWTGDLILCANRSLLRVARNGAVATVQIPSVQPMHIKVLHQSSTGQEQFLVSQATSWMQDVFLVSATGVVRTLISGTLQVRDVEAFGSRPLWARGRWTVGGVGRLNLNPGRPYAHHAYRLALSLSHGPGIDLGGARLHLAPDALFRLTATGDVPGFTRGFSGVLDERGRAVVPPQVRVPAVPALRGLRVFGGGVTFDGKGISGATNCWGITIQ